jgi:predicted RNase H-like HicB family nuclease
MGVAEMNDYEVVITKYGNGWSAYVPDLPGCVAAAETRRQTEQLIREAIKMHLEDMLADGEVIPPPSTSRVQDQVPA